MTGMLDAYDQAFLTFDCDQGPISFLVDTGFSGPLMIGTELFDRSFGRYLGRTEVVLADGEIVRFSCYRIRFRCFEHETWERVFIGPGTECLIGTDILKPHRLTIDYRARTVELQPTGDAGPA